MTSLRDPPQAGPGGSLRPPASGEMKAGASAAAALIGSVVGGKYTLGRLLGQGGMGAVFEASDSEGNHYAVKVLLESERGSDPVRRFVREARAVMAIKSDNVVKVVAADTDSDQGAPYIVMELLCGTDLDRVVKEHGALEPAATCRIFMQACLGLAAAHAVGIVHRDIKPANIFLHELPDGRIVAKICDFGVAKQTTGDLSNTQSKELTQTGGIVGSPMFMSPEQAKSARHVDLRTDVWSLAISMHMALTGKKPWQNTSSLGELILAICTQDIVPLQDAAPWVDPALADVVHEGLLRDPDERYSSLADMALALEPFALPAAETTRAALLSLTADRRSLIAPRATGHGASRSGASMRPSSQGSPGSAPQAGRRGGWVVPAGITGGLLVAAIGVGLAARGKSDAPPAAGWAPGGASSSGAPAGGARRFTARVAVRPAQARVLVGGAPRSLSAGGELLLEGEAGEVFDVVAEVGEARTVATIIISREGLPSPASVQVAGVASVGGTASSPAKLAP
jgi:eukaryotic-like serine/threonine-protein kinase